MKQSTIKKMQERFVGKICTVIMTQLSRNDFTESQFADFFTGSIDEIDEDGVLMTHTITGCKNYYMMGMVAGIIEEQVLYDDKPEHKSIIEQMKNKKIDQEKAKTNDETLINIDELSALADSKGKS
jgi:cyclopropane fatty-acyl-phospholipid synthase-like methyltransferase